MRRNLFAAVVLAAFSGLATQHALLVGINQYTNPGCPPLQGCVTDANRMSNLLTTGGGGWTSSTIKKLTDASASRTAVLNALQTFANTAVSGDTFIFFQSSHGGQNELCAADANITAAELGTCLRQFKAGVKVLCVIDSCFSGSLANKEGGTGTAKARAPMDFTEFVAAVNKRMDELAMTEKDNVPKLSNADIGWCTAVDATHESGDLDATFGALFAYPFIQSARSGAADVGGFCYQGQSLSYGNEDGNCTAKEAYWSAYNVVAAGTGGGQMPAIFNESVCEKVVLAKSSLANINVAADCDLSFDSYAYSANGNLEGGAGFFGQTKVSYDGSSALACSPVIPLQVCALDANVVVVQQEGMLTFRWKASSDVPSSAKKMRLWVDDSVVREYSGSSWQQETVSIPGAGSHYVSWEYYIDETKLDTITSVDENCGYIDNISWKGSYPDENIALDNTYLTFEQTRNNTSTAWSRFDYSGFGHGDSTMVIGTLPAGSWSSIRTVVTGPCIVDWGWLCQNSGERSALQFYVDDEYQFDASAATSSFEYPAFYVPAGSHTVEWCYLQDTTKTGDGSDIAVLDWVGVYYPASFTATSFAVEPPPSAYQIEGMNFYEVGRDITMPGTGTNWECDYDGNVYGAGASFRMPLAPVSFTAVEAPPPSNDESAALGANVALDNAYLAFDQIQGNTSITWNTISYPGFAHGDSMMAIGNLPPGSWSSIRTVVTGPCVIDWGWLCLNSGERSALQFYVDDEYQFDASAATSSFEYPAFYVPAGSHTVEWCYLQDTTKTGDGSDIAVLDWVGVYYPASFTATSFAVEPPPSAYQIEGMNFYEVGRDITMPGTGTNWECDYDGNVYGAGASFRMPLAPVSFMAIEETATGTAYDVGTFELYYGAYSAVTTKGSWNGFVMDDYGSVVGVIEVKAAALRNSKSKVTFAVKMFDKAKIRVRGEMSLNLGDGPDCTAVGGGTVITAYFRHQNVWGRVGGYFFDCARDYSLDRDAAAAAYTARVKAAKANYVMSVVSRPQSGRLEMGSGFVGMSLAVDAKGKTKITGVLPDGTKLNSTVYMAADDAGLWIPVWAQFKKGYFGGHILSMSTLRADRDKIGDWHNEKMHSFLFFDDASKVSDSRPTSVAAAFYLPSSYGAYPTAIDGAAVLMASLPSYSAVTAVQFGGNKWNILSNNSCKLKLTYVPKTGLIKGNFTIFTAANKKLRADVNGAYINGWGNCNAGVKGKVTMPMMIGAL